MAAIKRWLLGRHVTRCVLNVQAIGSDGTLSDGGGAADTVTLVQSTGQLHSTLAFTAGLLDSLEFSDEKIGENIQATHRDRAHNVGTVRSTGFTLREIMRNNANNNLLARAFYNGASKVVKLTYSRADLQYVVYALMLSYDEDMQRGKNLGVLVCGPVDAGVAPTYATDTTP